MDRRERVEDFLEALRAAMDGRLAEAWTALPGIVQDFHAQAMTVSVQPAIRGRLRDEHGRVRSADLPLLVDVPVVFPAGGGFTLTFPVKQGDECLVVFSSRCIDAWWQSGGVGEPLEPRMHDLSDGFALVGPRSQARVLDPAVDPEAVQLRSDDGRTSLTITPGGEMRLAAPTRLVLAAPEIVVEGDIQHTGDVQQDGDFSTSGEVSAGPAGVGLTTHVHPGVQPGSGSTGVPQ